ncbi:hypothetical protein LPJ77_005196, partial [Coemansia sp. RSA 2523]
MAQRRASATPIIVGSSVAPPRLASLRSTGSPSPMSPTRRQYSPQLTKRQRTSSPTPDPVPLPRLKTAEDYTVMDAEQITNLPIAYFCRDTRHGIPTPEFIDKENETLRKMHEARAAKYAPAEPPIEETPDEDVDIEGSGDDAVAKPEGANRMAARVRIVDGQVVIDSDSLVINRSDMADGKNEPLELVDESEQPRFINTMSYVRQRTSRKLWTSDETDEFYKALRKFGTDFQMCTSMLPDRNRYDIRNKFRKEERKNPLRITDALLVRDTPEVRETPEVSDAPEVQDTSAVKDTSA